MFSSPRPRPAKPRDTAIWLAVLLLVGRPAAANEPAAPPPPQTVELSDLLHEVVLAHLPHEYENTKQWGGTKQVWDGLRISLDGLRIKTKRRKKEANHGTWKRYKAWLVDPSKLRIRATNIGRTDSGRAAFDLIVTAKLGAFARLSEWNRDVQLISVSINAEADITLSMQCEMGLALDFEHFPPDVRLQPVVRDADLRLDQFRLRRVSDLHGPVVRELGKSLHTVLQREIDQRRNKLTAKLNRQIEKHADELRFSLHDLLQDEVLPLFDAAGAVAL